MLSKPNYWALGNCSLLWYFYVVSWRCLFVVWFFVKWLIVLGVCFDSQLRNIHLGCLFLVLACCLLKIHGWSCLTLWCLISRIIIHLFRWWQPRLTVFPVDSGHRRLVLTSKYLSLVIFGVVDVLLFVDIKIFVGNLLLLPLLNLIFSFLGCYRHMKSSQVSFPLKLGRKTAFSSAPVKKIPIWLQVFTSPISG